LHVWLRRLVRVQHVARAQELDSKPVSEHCSKKQSSSQNKNHEDRVVFAILARELQIRSRRRRHANADGHRSRDLYARKQIWTEIEQSRCRSEMRRVTLCRNTLDVRGCDMRQGERALTLTLLGLERVAADSHHSIKHSSRLGADAGLLHGLLATCSPRICGPEPAPLRDGNHH
jgi:hypothetical protein